MSLTLGSIGCAASALDAGLDPPSDSGAGREAAARWSLEITYFDGADPESGQVTNRCIYTRTEDALRVDCDGAPPQTLPASADRGILSVIEALDWDTETVPVARMSGGVRFVHRDGRRTRTATQYNRLHHFRFGPWMPDEPTGLRIVEDPDAPAGLRIVEDPSC